MTPGQNTTGRGTALLLVSTFGFAVLYYLTPLLAPLNAETIAALRIVLGTFALLIFFAASKSLGLITETWRHLRAAPWRIPVVLLCGALVASQLWLFAYGPISGRALQVSLGYFLMPLVLVIIGRFLYHDVLAWWHWLAVTIASGGIVYEVIRVGGFAWEALWVALLYPLYFVIRRAIGTSHLGGMFWELTFVSPFAAALFIWQATQLRHIGTEMWLLALAISTFGTCILIVWILSAKYLPMSLFGLLSYLEPGLLMLVSILLGEALAPAELPLYLAVWVAVLIIVIGGTVTALQKRSSRKQESAAVTTGDGATAAEQGSADETETLHLQNDDAEQMLVFAATGSIPIIDLATITPPEDPDARGQA